MVPPSISAALAPAAYKGKHHHRCLYTNTANEKIMSQNTTIISKLDERKTQNRMWVTTDTAIYDLQVKKQIQFYK